MSWREAFLVRFGPGAIAGITLGRWLRVLRENHFAVDRPYWGRAAVITLASIRNTLLAAWENWSYGRKVRDARVAPPLFILGIAAPEPGGVAGPEAGYARHPETRGRSAPPRSLPRER